MDIFFNTFDDSDVAKVSIATTTEPYSCVITGCARSITSCWASLKQTVAQCEFKGQSVVYVLARVLYKQR